MVRPSAGRANPLYLTLWLKQLEPQRLTELLGPVATVQWSYQGQK